MRQLEHLGFGHRFLNIIKQTLFPLSCASCHMEGSFLCSICATTLPFSNRNNLKKFHASKSMQYWSCFKYTPPISDLIILGKYSFLPEVYEYLGFLVSQKLKDLQTDLTNSLLCPIPLSKQRLRWRGFNQSKVLTKTLSETLGLPWGDLLIRTKNTKTQKDLNAKQRQINTANAFALNQNLAHQIHNKNIILIDDVITTGSTLLAASEPLLTQKPAKIQAITIAKD